MLERQFAVAARRRRAIDTLVGRVAEASVEAVCQLVGDRISLMGVCEARGYVRARAGREVRRQARLAFSAQPGVNTAWEPLVVLRAAERVAPMALRQLAAGRMHQESAVLRRHAA